MRLVAARADPYTAPVWSDAERERLRETFDQAAEIYQRVRPDYPEALFDDLIALAGLAPGDRLLEVGCATGKATLPLARRGFRITCVELGGELAAVARRNLAGFDVEVVEGRFEDWRPGAAGQPGVRGHRVALGGSGRAVPAGLGSAAAWRAPGRLEAGARVPGQG